jgi:hypothetical protein
VVLGGLVVSTVFTLILIPILFNLTMLLRESVTRGRPRSANAERRDDEPVVAQTAE